MDYEERRSSKRYHFRFPLKVHWPGTRESLTEALNVSSRGVYFFLPEPLPLGAPIDFVMTLFPELTETKPVHVNCRGRVQRSEVLTRRRFGIAASIDSYEFVRPRFP